MRYLTAGESHGPQLTAIIEGIPSGLELTASTINAELEKRQRVYGRGGRMKIESDEIQILSGVRHGRTLGSPITLVIQNKDFENHKELMAIEPLSAPFESVKTVPRPGHADLSGAIKYDHRDLQNVLERASARETAIRVAVGAVYKTILKKLDICVEGKIKKIGLKDLDSLKSLDDIIQIIDEAKKNGDSLGGIVEVTVIGLPVGIGSYVHYDRKLDAKLAHDILSVQLVKGVRFGSSHQLLGSMTHDEISFEIDGGFFRKTNRTGGIEGGMSNGMPIVLTVDVKPIPTLYKPLASIDLLTKEKKLSMIERSDTTGVTAIPTILESVVSTTLGIELLKQFTSDTMAQLTQQIENHRHATKIF